MSYRINETVKTVQLPEPFVSESFKVKRDLRQLPGALAYLAVAVVIFVALAYVGETFHLLVIGEGQNRMSLIGFVGAIICFVGLRKVAITVDDANEKRTNEQDYRKRRYSREVLMPAIDREIAGITSMTDFMAEQLMREGRAGMWSRINDDSNDGNVYEFTLKDDILTIASHVQVAEATDEVVGFVK